MAKSNQKPGGDLALKRKLRELEEAARNAKGSGLSAYELLHENEFVRYVGLLAAFSKRYTVLIVSFDTPCGPSLSPELAGALMKLGLKINLSGMFRRSYAAVVHTGEVLYEALSSSPEESVFYESHLEGSSIVLESTGFGAGRPARIALNGDSPLVCKRGLNFVVCDLVTGRLIDAVTFDTYRENLACARPSAYTEGMLSFMKAHPGVTLLCFNRPEFPVSALSRGERYIKERKLYYYEILQAPENPNFVLHQYLDSSEKIKAVLTTPTSYRGIRGVRQFEDRQGSCVNIAGGHRITANQPRHESRTIYLVGGCHVFGIGARDQGTIASHLQRLCNEQAPGQGFSVQNYGFFLMETNGESNEELEILNALPVKAGDLVLCNFGIDEQLPLVEMRGAAKRPHDYGEVFFDSGHFTENGYRMIADQLFLSLKEKDFYPCEETEQPALPVPSASGNLPLAPSVQEKLDQYKEILMEFYNSMFGLTIGSIVMNCNPFTLGHRYLIEEAAAQVDHLMVFVVQEDRSVFPFSDRLALVEKGVADLKNVSVIPSGSFIISSLTFSEYFNKSELQDRSIDASLDVTLFAQEIAPCLNISIRFAGEEPFDLVTRQYNDTMRSTLPQYGIAFVELPRKEEGGAPISASRVRELLKTQDFPEIARLVPASTLEYLKHKFQV